MPYILNPALELNLVVAAPDRKIGLRYAKLDRRTNRKAFDLALAAANNPGAEADVSRLKPSLLKKLLNSGLVIEESVASEPLAFSCDLIGQDMASVIRELPSGPLVVNRRLWLQENRKLPPPLARRVAFTDLVAEKPHVLWTEDPVTAFVSPIRVDESLVPVIEALRTGKDTNSLDTRLRAALFTAGVLYDRAEVKHARATWKEQLTTARDRLKRDQYVVVRGLLPRLFGAAIGRYTRELQRQGQLRRHDAQERHRDVRHNEPVNRFVHSQLVHVVNRFVPEPIKPSYCYLSTYKFGSQLKKHVDRDQNAWNLSLQLDNQPNIAMSDAWPIFLEIEGKKKKITLDIGDGAVYRGNKAPHWRPPLPRGRKTTLCFYAFVHRSFKGELD